MFIFFISVEYKYQCLLNDVYSLLLYYILKKIVKWDLTIAMQATIELVNFHIVLYCCEIFFK